MKFNVVGNVKKVAVLAMCLSLYGCGGNDAEQAMQVDTELVEEEEIEAEEEIEEVEEEEVEEEIPQIDRTGQARSPLTGIYIDEEIAARRPIAVVINNLRRALPQSGIGQADLVYEVLAEGNVTRIIAIFQNSDSEKIGPIRSTRHYFMNFAMDHDAIFMHHGGSQQGLHFIRNHNIDNLDGMILDGTAVWRDQERLRQSGMFEHSAFTSMANMRQAAEGRFSYRMERNENLQPIFQFFDEFSSLGGERAARITVPFASGQVSVFEYDEENGVYRKYQNGEQHMDSELGEQITVTNVIVQQAVHNLIPNDPEGRRDVLLVGSGTGYLFSAGEYVRLRWEKASHASPTVWTHEDGTPLTLNQGSTWVNIVISSISPTIEDSL